MPAAGKLIVFEGIDGSGKRTQLERLSHSLRERGIEHATISFPRYGGFFGRMVAEFLNGGFGRLEEVNPYFSALLYAGDRLENKPALEGHLARGKIVLADRYVASNLAHQGARIPPRKRGEFLRWLETLEYRVYGLPREDLVIYLRLPAGKAQQMVGRKAARRYTRRRRDLQEADLAHLVASAGVYQKLGRRGNWMVVNCLDRKGQELRSPEAIHREIMASIDKRISRSLGKARST